MKNIGTELRNYDREQFRRVALDLPEQEPEQSHEQPAKVFNELFRQLRATFPASMSVFKSQADLDDFRRQWLLAFAENGITTIAQVDAGMRVARRQDRPFMPSPGQFVNWCKEGDLHQAGLPDAAELVAMVHDYCARRGFYDAPEAYPWERAEHYWLVTALYSGMRANNWTPAELQKKAESELAKMAGRINRGEVIQQPRAMLPQMGGKPVGQKEGLAKIAELRAKFGLRGGLK